MIPYGKQQIDSEDILFDTEEELTDIILKISSV